MSNFTRRSFFKTSSIAAGATVLSLAFPKQTNAQEDNELFLPLVSMPSNPENELTALLRMQHLDEHIIQIAALMEPYIHFTGEQFEIVDSFNADKLDVTAEQLAYIDMRLDYKNAQLKNNSMLKKVAAASNNEIKAASCNRSGIEFGFWHQKIYFTSQEANDIARDLGRLNLGLAVGPALWKWFQRIPYAGAGLTAFSIMMSGYGQWITESNSGCGIVMYYMDMAMVPFWIAGQ